MRVALKRTRREAKVARLDAYLIAEERSRGVHTVAEFGLNVAETHFMFDLRRKHPAAEVVRHGWPDFLLRESGKTFGVEVKKAGDSIRQAQRTTFAFLESLGIPVYVWNPATPDILLPWRKYQPGK